jgi:hypothetical protein
MMIDSKHVIPGALANDGGVGRGVASVDTVDDEALMHALKTVAVELATQTPEPSPRRRGGRCVLFGGRFG